MTPEIFSPIEDPDLVATCNEIFTGDYRYLQDKEQEAQYGTGSDMLVNPDVELLTVQASYLEEAPAGNMQQAIKSATFGPELPPVDHLVEMYADSVGKLQKWGNEKVIVNMLAHVKQFEEGWEAVNEWYENEVAKQGRSLLSAHFVGRIIGGNNIFVETLVYPEHIRKNIGRLIRDGIISTLPQFDPAFQAAMRDNLIDNERIHTVASDICASNQLLGTKDYRRLFGGTLKQLLGPN